MTKIVFNDDAFRKFVNQPKGPVAAELFREAGRILQETKANLSVPAPTGRRQQHAAGDRVPWTRSGDLVNSLHIVGKLFTENGLIAVGINADAIHHGKQYDVDLLEKGWRLAPKRIQPE